MKNCIQQIKITARMVYRLKVRQVKRIITEFILTSQALIDKSGRSECRCFVGSPRFFWKGESKRFAAWRASVFVPWLKTTSTFLVSHLPLWYSPWVKDVTRNWLRLLDIEVGGLEGGHPQSVAMFGGEIECANDGCRVRRKDWPSFWTASHYTLLREQDKMITTVRLVHRWWSRLHWVSGFSRHWCVYLWWDFKSQTLRTRRVSKIFIIFAAGHHATERYGVKALGEWLAKELGLDVEFIDIDNPV